MFISSSKIVHAQRHVQTKGHLKEQQYYFVKQMNHKKFRGLDIELKSIKDSIAELKDIVKE